MKLDELPAEKTHHMVQKRFIFLASVLVFVLVSTTISIDGKGDEKAVQTSIHARNTSLKGAGGLGGPIDNPGFTRGPRCVMHVHLLMDRSGSIMGNAGGTERDANYMKDSVKEFYGVLSANAQGVPGGSAATVGLDAFATYAISQNMVTPDDHYGPKGSDWLSTIDISNTATHTINIQKKPAPPATLPPMNVSINNLDYQKQIVQNVWYRGGRAINVPANTGPYDPSNPDSSWKGYYGGLFSDFTPLRDSTPGPTGTNYDDAFISAARQISFWTNSWDTSNGQTNWNKRGDDDFDLVLMVTDGLPTMNDGPDHQLQMNEPGLTASASTGPEDLLYALNDVNTLRSGNAYLNPNGTPMTGFYGKRPPVNVMGIIVGSQANNPTARSNMTTMFGPELGNPGKLPNWFATENFSTDVGGLSDVLKNAITKFNCGVPPAKTDVSLTTDPAVGVEVMESDTDTYSFKVTVTNKSNVPLKNTKVTVNGTPLSGFPSTLGKFGEASATKTVVRPFTVPMGFIGSPTPNELTFQIKFTSDIVRAPGQTCDAPECNLHPSAQKTLTYTIKRSALPS